MKYLEWNNIIASYLFKPENGGRDIHLYITKADIINLGKKFLENETDEAVWNEFLVKIKAGLPGSAGHPHIIDKAIHAYQQAQRPGIKSIEGVELLFPPYTAYLAFTVLPLIEIQGNYNANNYYDRLDDFLRSNSINQNLRNRLKEIEPLWADLSNWANTVKNGEFGYFNTKNFIHQNWVYVGKPFSQCVLPPRALNRMPEMFLESGLVPGSFYTSSEFKSILLSAGVQLLKLPESIIEVIRKSETNELGQSIIDTTKKEYNKWTGESHIYEEHGSTYTIKRNYTPSRLYLQLEPQISAGTIKFSYRLYSSNEYPGDLKLGSFDNIYEARGWSKTLDWPFKPSFDEKDDLNKWIAKFPYKDIWLFVSASNFQFSADYWLETDTLSRTDNMFILCSSKFRETIMDWGKKHCSICTDESDLEGMPAEYSLLKIYNPKESHAEIPALTVYTAKTIQLTNAVNVTFRTFLSDYLPLVEITNATGEEKVYLQYRHSQEKLFLRKSSNRTAAWELPEGIQLDTDFYLKIDGEALSGNQVAYKIISANGSCLTVDSTLLPKRNPFGKVITGESEKYCIGSNTVGTSLMRQLPFSHLFKGTLADQRELISTPEYIHHEGNILLSFLTVKQSCTTEDFYRAFEFLHLKRFENKLTGRNINYSKIKKASLNFFDYLGFLDYEYETKQIVVNPPQLIYIPSNTGRKCLLIGARDEAFVKQFIAIAPKFNLQVEITKQLDGNEILLLPDAITIKAFASEGDSHGEKSIGAFAEEMKIGFSSNDLIQLSLQNFSADIEEYLGNLLVENKTSTDDYNWGRKLYNTDSLNYEWHEDSAFDRAFSLLEYKLNEYTFHNKIWIRNECYVVDKNWGKYLALKNANRQVILYDEKKQKVAIPVELPLPRILAEALMLLSGIAPAFMPVNGRNYRLYENIPSIFIQNLFQKLKQKIEKQDL